MSGRGRGLTLPAWMTQESGEANPYVSMSKCKHIRRAELNFTIQPSVDLGSNGNNGQPSIEAASQDAAADQNGGSSTAVNTPVNGAPPAGMPYQVGAPYGMPNPGQIPGQFVPGAPMGMPPGVPPYAPPMGYPMPAPAAGQYFQPPLGAGAMPFMAAPTAGSMGMIPPTVAPIIGRNLGIAGAKAPATGGIQDSNNDASAWSEHLTEQDQRKYWFNKVTQKSTFDKPECLKTPEERSIPPCPWKEYATPEGKKYYHNGIDTVYVVLNTFA